MWSKGVAKTEATEGEKNGNEQEPEQEPRTKIHEKLIVGIIDYLFLECFSFLEGTVWIQ